MIFEIGKQFQISEGSFPLQILTQILCTKDFSKCLQGPATIIATCVEDKEPFRAHPNNLIGKNCVKGICRMIIGPETKMTAVFEKIGIECVRRNDIPTSLKHRLEMKGSLV